MATDKLDQTLRLMQSRVVAPAGGPRPWPKLASAALYGLAGDFVRTIAPHSEADPAALLFQFLAAAGTVFGRNRYFLAEETRHHPALWVAVVGNTAKARKGTSWQRINAFMERACGEWRALRVSGLSSGEGLISMVRDADAANEDPGVADKRCFIIEQEMARVLQVGARDSNTLSPVLREAWDGADLAIRTKKPMTASEPHIGIAAHITRSDLTTKLPWADVHNGFGNRFLWVCAQRPQLLPLGSQVPPSSLNSLISHFARSLSAAASPSQVKLEGTAEELWKSHYFRLDQEDRKTEAAGERALNSIVARGEAQTVRLALVFALLDCSSSIKGQHLEAAIAAWQYCEDSAAYLFAGAASNTPEDQVIAAMRKGGGQLTRTEISVNVFKGHKKSTELDAIRHELSRRDAIGFDRRMAKDRGPPVETWFLKESRP